MALNIAVVNQVLKRSQEYSIRQAVIEDLAQISAIENNTSSYPCSYQQLHDCIESTYLLIGDNRLLGFAVIVMVEKQAEAGQRSSESFFNRHSCRLADCS